MWEIFLKQGKKCALTGEILYFSPIQTDRKKSNASLDRIDSSKGYTENNIQWVLKNINLMKRELSDKDFIEICRKVVQYKGSIAPK